MEEIKKLKENIEKLKFEIENLIRQKNEMEEVYQNSFEIEKVKIIQQFNELVEEKENKKNIALENLNEKFKQNIQEIEEKNKELFEMNQQCEVSIKNFENLKSECKTLNEKHESMLKTLQEYEVCKIKNEELVKKLNDINFEHMNLLTSYKLLENEIAICKENKLSDTEIVPQKKEKIQILENLLKKNDDEYKNIAEQNKLKEDLYLNLNLINQQDELINELDGKIKSNIIKKLDTDKIKKIEDLINTIKFKDDNQKNFYIDKFNSITNENDIANLYNEIRKSVYSSTSTSCQTQNINTKFSDSSINHYKIQKVINEFENSIILNYGYNGNDNDFMNEFDISEVSTIFEIYGECNAVDLKKDPPVIDSPKVYHLFGNEKFFGSIDHSNFISEQNLREYRIKQGRIIDLFGKTLQRSLLVSVIKKKKDQHITILNIPPKEYPNDILLKYFSQFLPNLSKPLISISSFLSYTKNEVQKLILNRLKLKYPNRDIYLIYKNGNELHIPSNKLDHDQKHVKINIDVTFEEISKFLKESLFLNEMSEHVRYFFRDGNVSLNKLVLNKLGSYSTQIHDMYNPYLCFTNPTKSIVSKLYSKIESFTVRFPKRLILCHLDNPDDCDEVLQILMYIDGMVIDEKKIEETGFFWSYFFV